MDGLCGKRFDVRTPISRCHSALGWHPPLVKDRESCDTVAGWKPR